MFEGLFSAIGDLFGSGAADTATTAASSGGGFNLGSILTAAAPAAIAAFASGQQASETLDYTKQQDQLKLQEAQKERDLALLLQKLKGGGGGGGSAAAMLSAKGGILDNVVSQILAAAKLKNDAINQGTQNAQAPLLTRLQNPRVG